MSSPAITVEPHWPLASVAEQMVQRGVNRLPVIQNGRLVGIVTRADLVRAFARSHDAIAAEIRELVALQQELYRDDKPIAVSSAAGEVALAGEVRRRDEAEIIPRMARTVPGVVSVRSELTWAEHDQYESTGLEPRGAAQKSGSAPAHHSMTGHFEMSRAGPGLAESPGEPDNR